MSAQSIEQSVGCIELIASASACRLSITATGAMRRFFSSGMADHALRLGPYMRISCYQENFNMDIGGRMRIGKS